MYAERKAGLARLHSQEVWLAAAAGLESIAAMDFNMVWTQGYAARDIFGTHVNVDDEAACMWCADGLIDRFLPSGPAKEAGARALASLIDSYEAGKHPGTINAQSTVWDWNDASKRRYTQVRRAFKAAAGRALQFAELASA